VSATLELSEIIVMHARIVLAELQSLMLEKRHKARVKAGAPACNLFADLCTHY
jgi:hypothetical protein